MEVVENYCGLKTKTCLFALYEFSIVTIKFNIYNILIFTCGMVKIFKLCKCNGHWLLFFLLYISSAINIYAIT